MRLNLMPSFLRGQRQLISMMVLITLVMAGASLISPMLPLYGAQFGVGGTMIGMLITIFGVGRLVANIPAGLLTDRLGRRTLLCAGPLVIGIGSVGAALATSFEVLLVCRLVQGIGSGIYMTTASTTLIEFADPAERGRIMSFYQAALIFGIGIGPGIGGFLSVHLGFTAPFWGYALVSFVTAALAFFTYRDAPPVAPAAGPVAGPQSLGALLTHLPFIFLCLLSFGLFFTRTGALSQSVPLIANQDFSVSLDVIGLALTGSAAVNFFMIPVVGPTIDRYGARTISILSTLVSGLGLILLAVPHVAVFWIGMLVVSIGNGFNGPAIYAALGDEVPRALYGPAIGFQRAVGDAGFVLGPLLVGVVYDLSGGHAGGLLLNAAVMILAGIAFALAARRSPRAG